MYIDKIKLFLFNLKKFKNIINVIHTTTLHYITYT